MNNQKLADIFKVFTHIFEIRGGKNDFFRVRSYQKVVQTLENLDKDIAEYIDLENKKFKEKINGIGKETEHKIIEFLETENIKELEELKKTIPNGLLEMLEIKNLGPKKVKKFYKELEITNIEELKKAVIDGRIEKLEGMGKKSAEKILEGIEILNQFSERKPIGSIYHEIQNLLEEVKKHPLVIKAEIAGSFRRFKESVGDIDLLVAVESKNRDKFIKDYLKMNFLEKIENQGDTKVTAYLKLGLQIDLRLVELEQFGAALQYFTGNQNHNINLRSRAKKMGYKINEYGLFEVESEKLIASKTEKEIYNKLGLEYIEPNLRGGTNEIQLAEKKELPKTIELKDIKGDCHTHCTYSDGKNSIREMAQKAQDLGYEYIAITDHSQSLKIANGLTKERVFEKKLEIQKIQPEFKIKILLGTEVDILKDGGLDYEDDLLKEFDFVVASLHIGIENNPEERYLKAIENPYVNCIGHITTREIGKRKELEMDYEKILKKASEKNVIVEINASEKRLDMPQDIIALAVKHNTKIMINTDAHSTKQLENMVLGIQHAKVSRLKKDQIINTLKWAEFKSLLR